MSDRLAELEAQEEAGDLSDAEERELANIRRIEQNITANEQFEDRFTGQAPDVQLYIFEPAAFGGDGRAAIVLGDLDTAEHVALTVPGFSSSVSGMDPGRVQALYEESRGAVNGRESVAVVDWMGYDSPNPDFGNVDFEGSSPLLVEANPSDLGELLDLVGEIGDALGVGHDAQARAGAELLAGDVAGSTRCAPSPTPATPM